MGPTGHVMHFWPCASGFEISDPDYRKQLVQALQDVLFNNLLYTFSEKFQIYESYFELSKKKNIAKYN